MHILCKYWDLRTWMEDKYNIPNNQGHGMTHPEGFLKLCGTNTNMYLTLNTMNWDLWTQLQYVNRTTLSSYQLMLFFIEVVREELPGLRGTLITFECGRSRGTTYI